jgi:catechol 2,3-dioxygenase-like lactoylglutathione lyase family enzyme
MNDAPKTTGLLETAIHAADIQGTADFYRRVLGLAPLLETPRLVALDAGGASVLLVFQAGATEADFTDERGTVPGHGGATLGSRRAPDRPLRVDLRRSQ